MIFERISSTEPVVTYLTNTILTALQEEKRVLWLVTGGSGIAIDAAVSKQLSGKDLHNLMVTLTDERFGPVGHSDSNWQQLAEAGFELNGAQVVPVLSGVSLVETTANYNDTVKQLLEQADFSLGFFGMGPDGHIAGSLPGSSSVTSSNLADSYKSDPFTRLTLTPLAISHLDEIVVCAMGDTKLAALENLKKDLPLLEQPAQIIKQVEKVTVFNDQIGN